MDPETPAGTAFRQGATEPQRLAVSPTGAVLGSLMVCYFQAVVECVFVRTESLAWPLRRFLVMREVQPGTGEGAGA